MPEATCICDESSCFKTLVRTHRVGRDKRNHHHQRAGNRRRGKASDGLSGRAAAPPALQATRPDGAHIPDGCARGAADHRFLQTGRADKRCRHTARRLNALFDHAAPSILRPYDRGATADDRVVASDQRVSGRSGGEARGTLSGMACTGLTAAACGRGSRSGELSKPL